jgi:chemotaxis signal transduction protein
VEEAPRDPGVVLDPLKGKVDRFLLSEEEEAPTITVEAIRGEGDLLFDELDRAVEEALAEEPTLAEEADLVGLGDAEQETVILKGLGTEETVEPEIRADFSEGMGEEIEEEFGGEEAPREEVPRVPLREAVASVAPEAPSAAGEPEEELERVRGALAESGAQLQRFLDRLQTEGDPLGLRAVVEGVSEKFRQFFQSLGSIVAALQERIRALEDLDLVRRPPEQAPEQQANREEVLFISVSNRIFGIPLGAVRGIFRVPSKAVSQIVQAAEVELKGRTVPLISLWKKLGLGRALYTFPKEEKRVLLVTSGTGEVGLLVDQVLARQEVTLRPVEAEQRSLFRGMVAVEKGAYVIDIETL